MIEFINPEWFFLIIIIPFFLLFLHYSSTKQAPFQFFTLTKKIFKTHSFVYYIYITLICFIIIIISILLANPNQINTQQKIFKNGVDIMLILDISYSMKAQDLQPNRIESAKNVLSEFVQNTQTDRLGLIVFAGRPFTSVPLTFDYKILLEILENTSVDTINQYAPNMGNTAIGDAILGAINNLSKQKTGNTEQVIILLTDGDANYGIDPIISAKLAKDKGIKIYTIGIGSPEGGFIEQNTIFGIQRAPIKGVDKKNLTEIAHITDGKYFQATDNNTFYSILQEISELEKTDIETQSYKHQIPYYYPFVISLNIIFIVFTTIHIIFFTKKS